MVLFDFMPEVILHFLGDLTFCVPETFGSGEFQEKFLKPWFGVWLLEMLFPHGFL